MSFILILAFPLACFASEPTDETLEQYVFAKSIAISYASDIKELRNQNKISFEDYFKAKILYQRTAAKFTVLKASLDGVILDNAKLSPEDIKQIKKTGNTAIKQFNVYIEETGKIFEKSPIGLDPTFNEKPIKKGIASEAFFTETGVTSLLETFVTIWSKKHEMRESKITRLISWLDKYYDWPAWEKIGTPATEKYTLTDEAAPTGKTVTKSREVSIQQ